MSFIVMWRFADGDLARGGLLIPTAILTNYILYGTPEDFAERWITGFLAITLVTWTLVWFLIIRTVAWANRAMHRRKQAQIDP